MRVMVECRYSLIGKLVEIITVINSGEEGRWKTQLLVVCHCSRGISQLWLFWIVVVRGGQNAVLLVGCHCCNGEIGGENYGKSSREKGAVENTIDCCLSFFLVVCLQLWIVRGGMSVC